MHPPAALQFTTILNEALMEPQVFHFPNQSLATQARFRVYNVRKAARRKGDLSYDHLEVTTKLQPDGSVILTIGPQGSGLLEAFKQARQLTKVEAKGHLGDTISTPGQPVYENPDGSLTPEGQLMLDCGTTAILEMFLCGQYDWDYIAGDATLLDQANRRGVSEALWQSAANEQQAKTRLLQCERSVGYVRGWRDGASAESTAGS